MSAPYIPPVTAHAILRYLKRVEGFDLAPIVKKLGRDAGSWKIARAAAEALGVPVIEIQKRICPQHLASAVAGGVARVKREGMVLVCAGGQVVSLYEDERRGQTRVLSRRELKRGLQRLDRRNR